MTWFDTLHFLRPHWLWLLWGLPLLAWGWRARRRRRDVWRDAIDPHLLPHLVERRVGTPGLVSLAAWLLAGALLVLALAGPAWRHAAQPLQAGNTPLVIAVDLSSSVGAADLPPSRLLRIRAKLGVVLAERQGGQVALLAYADDAFTVAPLTDDTRNVALYLDALSPDVMPADGSRADRAIAGAMRLLQQAGRTDGRILLLSDHADADAARAAASARSAGFPVSVLGVGTPAGAPVRDPRGGQRQAALDAASLQAVAQAGGGRYHLMTLDGDDLAALDVLDPDASGAGASDAGDEATTRMWRDEGYWLLLPLLVLGLLAFRRGAVVAVLVLAGGLVLQPAHAQAEAPAPSTWWQRADQATHRQAQDGVDAYRAERYDDAVRRWSGLPGADAAYNRGNALAKAGRYDEAIQAYDQALAARPGMVDAEANRQAVLAAQQRKPPPGPGQDSRGQPRPDDDASAGSPGDSGNASPSQGGQPAPADEESPPSRDPQPTPPQAPADADANAGTPPQAGDASTQQDADAAMRAQMQQALAQQAETTDATEGAASADSSNETPAERERRQANEAWLRRLPDDPGGLLRAKFLLEHQRRQGGRAP